MRALKCRVPKYCMKWTVLPSRGSGYALLQLVEALCYKPEGSGSDFRQRQFFRPHYDTGIDSASNRKEYEEYFLRGKGGRCVGLTLPPSCAENLEIWQPQPPGIVRVCPDPQLYCFILPYTGNVKSEKADAAIPTNVCTSHFITYFGNYCHTLCLPQQE